MRRMILTLVLLLFVRAAWPQDNPPEKAPPAELPASEAGEIRECIPPPMDKLDEFYEVNPTIRSLYYSYLRRGIPQNRNPQPSNEEFGDAQDQFLFRGRFKMYVSDLFNVNARLVQATKDADYLLKLDPALSASHSIQSRFDIIEKQSSRLAGRLMIVLPGDMDTSSAIRSQQKESYITMARKGYLKALTQLLLNKVSTFENRLCNFFFPASHTVSLYELSVHSTPYNDLKEIQQIARALADHFPQRGVPKGYHKQ